MNTKKIRKKNSQLKILKTIQNNSGTKKRSKLPNNIGQLNYELNHYMSNPIEISKILNKQFKSVFASAKSNKK